MLHCLLSFLALTCTLVVLSSAASEAAVVGKCGVGHACPWVRHLRSVGGNLWTGCWPGPWHLLAWHAEDLGSAQALPLRKDFLKYHFIKQKILLHFVDWFWLCVVLCSFFFFCGTGIEL